MSVAFSPSTTLFTLPGALIEWSIIIPYEDYNTFIKYISKSHLYCSAQPLVYSQTVFLPVTNVPDSREKLIDEPYEHVNHMYLFHCHHLYMNVINISIHCCQDQINLENIQHQYLPLINFLFPPQCWICISIPVDSLVFFCIILFNFIHFYALPGKQ